MTNETSPIQPRPAVCYFDAIIIGASIAGCVCALELANKGWRVLVLEKRKEADYYKKICTHLIHPGGYNKLAQLGVLDSPGLQHPHMTALDVRFASRSVFFPLGARLSASNIERKDLDPALKNKLIKHPNITLNLGYQAVELIIERNKVKGVMASSATLPETEFRAPVTIGADGRNSVSTKLANGSTKLQKNGRVALFRYYEKPSLPDDDQSQASARSIVFALEKGGEYLGYFPNNQHTLVSWYISAERYQAVATDREAHFKAQEKFLSSQHLFLGPAAGPVMVAKDTSPQQSKTTLRHFVQVGDAYLAADPLTGVGCTWAMSSASMLAHFLGKAPNEAILSALAAWRLNLGIKAYKLTHKLRFALPSWLMTFVSTKGHWVFNTPVYALLAWLSKPRGRNAARLQPPLDA